MNATGRLFSSGRIGALQLDNRIVLSPMCTLFCEESGAVNDTTIDWYATRAKGGAGLVVVEATQCATSVDALRMWSNALRADDDAFSAGLAALAQAVHDNGSKIGIQISPGAGAQASALPWSAAGEGNIAVSPSGIAALHSSRTPRILETSEIETIIESCADASLRVRNAGFDLINLHGHGGYLLAQFLSPYFNRRNDKYGGSAEKRFRFLLEMVEAIRGKVGSGCPITVKYSIDEAVDGGRGVEESQVLAKRLEQAGVDAIFIAVGAHGSREPIVPPHFVPRGSHIPLARAIKAVVKIPVVVGGRLNDAEFAEQVLRDGHADFIALGRALIADPEWPRKVASGSVREIRPCLACNACRQNLFTSEPVRCAINAVAGREAQYGVLKPAQARKRVIVVGGGPAGLEAARVAALRGHDVILCEKTGRLGGMLLLAAVFNDQIMPFTDWLKSQIGKLSVDVRLNTEASLSLIDEIRPDAAIFATGGEFLPLRVPGVDRKNVFSGQDLVDLAHGRPAGKGVLLEALRPLAKAFYSPAIARFALALDIIVGERVAILGGQQSGCKLAFHLCRKGKKVTILEESATYGADMEETTMDALNYEIADGNVRVLTSVKIHEITDEGVVLSDRDGRNVLQRADTVIIALGLGPKPNPLVEQVRTRAETHVIGDLNGFRGIREAVAEGHLTACRL